MTEFAIVLLAVALTGIAIYVVARRGSREAPTGATTTGSGAETEVVLPVDDADPDSPSTKRLVSDAAHRALARHPEVGVVVVVSRAGRLLGRDRKSVV